jgi:hypothetical protein
LYWVCGNRDYARFGSECQIIDTSSNAEYLKSWKV